MLHVFIFVLLQVHILIMMIYKSSLSISCHVRNGAAPPLKNQSLQTCACNSVGSLVGFPKASLPAVCQLAITAVNDFRSFGVMMLGDATRRLGTFHRIPLKRLLTRQKSFPPLAFIGCITPFQDNKACAGSFQTQVCLDHLKHVSPAGARIGMDAEFGHGASALVTILQPHLVAPLTRGTPLVIAAFSKGRRRERCTLDALETPLSLKRLLLPKVSLLPIQLEPKGVAGRNQGRLGSRNGCRSGGGILGGRLTGVSRWTEGWALRGRHGRSKSRRLGRTCRREKRGRDCRWNRSRSGHSCSRSITFGIDNFHRIGVFLLLASTRRRRRGQSQG